MTAWLKICEGYWEIVAQEKMARARLMRALSVVDRYAYFSGCIFREFNEEEDAL